jgi:hypothetical protein
MDPWCAIAINDAIGTNGYDAVLIFYDINEWRFTSDSVLVDDPFVVMIEKRLDGDRTARGVKMISTRRISRNPIRKPRIGGATARLLAVAVSKPVRSACPIAAVAPISRVLLRPSASTGAGKFHRR